MPRCFARSIISHFVATIRNGIRLLDTYSSGNGNDQPGNREREREEAMGATRFFPLPALPRDGPLFVRSSLWMRAIASGT